MVRIAIAGGSGNVGQEIIEALVAREKHEILILSRKDAPATELAFGVKWVKVDYSDAEHLAKALEGVHTVLSFLTGTVDPGSKTQGNTQRDLIDASIRAGVKRFAPSEWVTSKFDHMFWYAFKEDARKYLAEVNKEKKVLEYTLFQPGLFTNYFTFPFSSSKHVDVLETPFDFYQRRALMIDGGEDDILTLTTSQDVAKVVALAIEHEGEWPLVSGIRGGEITVGQLIALGEKIRGGSFAVEKLKAEDLEAGEVKAPWMPIANHPAIPPEMRNAFSASLVSGILLGISAGNFKITDEWNQLLPDYKFTKPEEFLTKAWGAIDAGAKSVYLD
ncbi:hypothetical protein EsH8_VIII_000205 [Colletotrichum jinshuiense]